jgi:hypothetical protein
MGQKPIEGSNPSLSANFSLKLGLDSNPRTMQVGLTDSHRESGFRHIVTSIQTDCEEQGRVVAEQSLSLRFTLLHFE